MNIVPAERYAPHSSPFILGTNIQFAWDQTSIGLFKECPRLYYLTVVCGWRAKGTGVHLFWGQHYHGSLELYDKRMAEGADHEEALDAAVDHALRMTWLEGDAIIAAGPWDSEHDTKTRETLVRSVIWYIEHFKDDPAKTVILANGKPAVELSFRMELDYGPRSDQPYVLCGHIDRLAEYTGGIYVTDRKSTGSALSSYYFDQYSPDNQMSMYSFAGKIIYSSPVKGVIIDAAQVMVGFTRFGRGMTYRTEGQLTEWLDDLRFWFAQAEWCATHNVWPMNDKSCHKYGGCVFRGICSKDPEVRERFLETSFEKRYWNPLESR